MNDPEKVAFLKALEENWNDDELRAIYSDWLEEHGEIDEANTQRNWAEIRKESKCWIENFANEINQTYENIIEAASRWINFENYTCTYENEEYKNVNYDLWKTFWKNYHILTGKMPKNKDDSFFSCSC